MRTSETFTKVIGAIHELQQELEILKRDDKVNSGSYSFKFTGMPTIWVNVKPLLKKNGLTVIQSPSTTNTGDVLITTIYHTSGEFIQDAMRLIVTRDDPQGIGSAITYAKRYQLSAMLGVVTDDDNDATTQRIADGEMKKEWVTAYNIVAKKQNPDHVVTNNDFINFMLEIYGKHPSKVLAKEHQNVLDTINAFK
jgi:hypothetical protein